MGESNLKLIPHKLKFMKFNLGEINGGWQTIICENVNNETDYYVVTLGLPPHNEILENNKNYTSINYDSITFDVNLIESQETIIDKFPIKDIPKNFIYRCFKLKQQENNTYSVEEFITPENIYKIGEICGLNDILSNSLSANITNENMADFLLSFICSEEKKQEKRFFYDFKYPIRLSKQDLEANTYFGSVFAEIFTKELQKKFNKALINIELVDLSQDTIDFFIKSTPDNSDNTSFLWNNSFALVQFFSEILPCILKAQLPNKILKKNTEERKKLYKKYIEKVFFKSLTKACKSRTKYNGNYIKKLRFTKTMYTNLLNTSKFPIQNDEIINNFTFDISIKTSSELITSTLNFAYDWRLAKEITANIYKEKKLNKKENIHNKLQDNEYIVDIQLGTTKISLKDKKKIKKDTVIYINQTPNSSVNLLINDKLIAKGQLLYHANNERFSFYTEETF